VASNGRKGGSRMAKKKSKKGKKNKKK